MSASASLDTSKTIQNLRPPDPPDGHDNSNIGKKVDSYLPLSFHALWTDPAAASPDDQRAKSLSTEQKPQSSQPESSMSASKNLLTSDGLASTSKALPAIPSLGLTTSSTSTQDLAPFSTSPSMVSRPDSAADRVNPIFARRHALANRIRSGPATPPTTTQLHQLVLSGNGGVNASTGNVSVISSPATTITTGVSPRSSASLESLGLTEGETEVDGEDLTGGTFVSTSTSTSASASSAEAETPDEDECAAANASADTIRTFRSTRASNTGTIKAKNGQSPGALLEMLVNENGGLFKENENLRAQVVRLKSEALVVDRARREKARKERADALGINQSHRAEKMQHLPPALVQPILVPSTHLSSLLGPPELHVTPAPRKTRTIEGLQKKLDRKREKHEITRRKLAWTKQQWASADYAGAVFATCFKQQRILADERGLAAESLQSRNGELQKRNEELEELLLAITRDRDAMASKREALKESEAIGRARVVELNARNEEALERIARLEAQNSILEERSSLVEEKNRELVEKNTAQIEEITRLVEQRDSVIEENTRLADKDTSYRHTNAKLLDRNAKLSLTIDDLETRVEELYSQLEGLQARNEELCETIHLLQEREEELEVIVEEAKAEIADLQQVVEEFETAYNDLRMNGGSARGDHDERASVTSEDMDIAGLEAAANAVGEDGEYVDVPELEGDNDATPSRSRTRTRSASHDRPPSTLSDVDTSDPIVVAAQIKRLQRLVDEYHDAIASLRRKRQAQEDRAVELAAIEDDLQKRLDEYKEISIDFRQRESDYFASCESREREFLDLSDEYERWRMDCEVREVDVEEDRIEVWRFRNEVEARLARCIKREEGVRRREGEVRWRMMCLDGAFGDREGEGCKCWRCLEPPAELFPPTPPTNFEWLDEEYEKKFGSPRRGRQVNGQQSQQEEAMRSREDEMDERYLREDLDDPPFEFDGREAVKRYLADQERHERERREDEYVDMEEEAERIRLSAEAYDEVVHGRVAELIRKADEKRRQIKERKERAAAGPLDGEIFGVYDESIAQLNVDGLHGLGLVANPDSYPDRYVEEDVDAEAGPSTSSSVSALAPAAPVASTSSSSSSNALADSSATRDSREGGVQGELSSSWEEVSKD